MSCLILQCIDFWMSFISILSMVDQEDLPCNEVTQKSYEILKSLAPGLMAWHATRIACRLFEWENPTYVQWGIYQQEYHKGYG